MAYEDLIYKMKKIVLIVGASGVGKDTLLRNIKDKIEANFVTRYITRVSDTNETNFYVDKDAFKVLQKGDFFVSTWEAHENHYGIAQNQIKDGLNIISISRASIKDFEKLYNDVTTISITLPREALYKRLKGRGREDEEQIQKRLKRSYATINATNLVEFINDKPLGDAIEEFSNLLESLSS